MRRILLVVLVFAASVLAASGRRGFPGGSDLPEMLNPYYHSTGSSGQPYLRPELCTRRNGCKPPRPDFLIYRGQVSESIQHRLRRLMIQRTDGYPPDGRTQPANTLLTNLPPEPGYKDGPTPEQAAAPVENKVFEAKQWHEAGKKPHVFVNTAKSADQLIAEGIDPVTGKRITTGSFAPQNAENAQQPRGTGTRRYDLDNKTGKWRSVEGEERDRLNNPNAATDVLAPENAGVEGVDATANGLGVLGTQAANTATTTVNSAANGLGVVGTQAANTATTTVNSAANGLGVLGTQAVNTATTTVNSAANGLGVVGTQAASTATTTDTAATTTDATTTTTTDSTTNGDTKSANPVEAFGTNLLTGLASSAIKSVPQNWAAHFAT